MSIHSRKLLLVASLTAVGMTMNVSPAIAQGLVLEEILVTARKRVESLQDVPVAVTVFDESTIERAQINTTADLEKFVPNVDFSDNPFAGQALGATIRGVGFSDFEKSFEPAVGFSIDGVFLASNAGAAIDSFDLEQVEVLRGPQGTLFGRNTVGGVINVTRSRPTGELGFKLGANIENNAGREYNLIANTGQIADVLSIKLHALTKVDETYSVDLITGAPEDQTDITSFGAAFLIEPNDNFEALISLDYFDDDSQGGPVYSLAQPSDLFCALPNFLSTPPPAGAGAFTPGTFNATCQSDSFDVAEASDFEVHTRGIPFITHINGSSATVNIEYDISDSLKLTSITGYRETDEQLFNEGLGARNLAVEVFPGFEVNFPALSTNRVQEAEQYSQEIRLSGDFGDRTTFVAGLFFMESEYSLTGGEFTFNGGPSSGFGTAFSFGAVSTDERVQQDTTAAAIFVDGTYEATDRLSISGGFRLSWEEKDFQKDFILSSVDGVTGTSASASESWTNPTGRLIAQYEYSDNGMVYGGWSRGIRSGGFNGRGASVSAIGPYDEETVDSFEAGIRAEFFGNRVRVNPTIFLAQYDDKQEENAVSAGGDAGAVETTVQNASTVDISGLELEILAQVTPSLTLRGAFGYLDAEFDEFLVPENPTDPTNTNLIDVSDSRNLRAGPDANVSVGATYIRSVMDGDAQLIVNAAYNWADELTTSAATDPLGLGRDTVDQVKGFDFSLGIETLRDSGPNWSATAYVNDAFDDGAGRNAVGVVVPGIFAFGAGGVTKVYGLDLSLEF